MTSYDLVTFGETMLRLSPPDNLRLEQTTELLVTFGGAESNVAANVSRLGKRVAWYSRLPENPLGSQCAAAIRRHGVDVSYVTWAANERIGTYFIEYGQAPRSIRVWYDRANSAASKISSAELPLDLISNTRWLHLTGITPALSENCAQAVQTAITHAKQHNVTVSFDVNYRALLWEPSRAAEALDTFCTQADYVFIALRDAHNLWKIEGNAAETAQKLQARWNGTVIVTEGNKGATAYSPNGQAYAPAIPATIVDRVGAGDAFASGVICRLLEDSSLEDALRFGTATATLKLGVVGDIAVISRAEVETLLKQEVKDLQR